MRFWTVLGLATALGLAACGDANPGLRGGVQVSFATRSAVTSPAPAVTTAPVVALDDTLTDAQANELIVESVEIVVREIQLKRVETAACNVDPEPAGCEDVELGPVLVELPLDPGADVKFAVLVPAGLYDEIEFDIHKPDDSDPRDQAFIAAYPDFGNVSIRVRGKYNGTPFAYLTDLNASQELALVPVLLISEQTTTNVTVFVAVNGWFRDADGDLVDPALANKGEMYENLVRDNIIRSIEAFEDPDRDGGRD